MKELHGLRKIVIWCSMHRTKIAGHYFFSDSTVAGEDYKRMLRYSAVPKIFHLPEAPLFQQDEDSPH